MNEAIFIKQMAEASRASGLRLPILPPRKCVAVHETGMHARIKIMVTAFIVREPMKKPPGSRCRTDDANNYDDDDGIPAILLFAARSLIGSFRGLYWNRNMRVRKCAGFLVVKPAAACVTTAC